ncbi:aldehyde dehydrogenase family protein, partial [Mycobacterium kansasii]
MTTIAVPDLLPAVADFVSRDRRMLIGGQWVDALSGRTFDTHDPATGQVITRVAHGEAPDIDRAVAAARAAYEGPWSR